MAARVWQKLLPACGTSRFYSGSALDRDGMLGNVIVGGSPVIEFRGAKFRLVPIPTQESERLNGISMRLRATMVATSFRDQGEPWQTGPAVRSRNIDDVFARVLNTGNSDMLTLGAGGAIAVELVKFKGKWAITRSSVDFSGGFPGGSSNYYDLEQFLAAHTPEFHCPSAGR